MIMNMEHQGDNFVSSQNKKINDLRNNDESIRNNLHPMDANELRRRRSQMTTMMIQNNPSLIKNFCEENKEIQEQIK